MKLKVAKFGGTSMADATAMRRAAAIIKSDPARRIVVVSAPGKRNASDTKVTDMLIECAKTRIDGKSCAQDIERLVARFADIHRELNLPAAVLDRIRKDLIGRSEAPMKNKSLFMESMKAAGEDNSAWLFAAALTAGGIPARYVNAADAGLILSAEHGNARVLDETYANLASLRDATETIVFPGFYGVTHSGDIVTFPRGGSDISGSVVAAAVKADLYENFTDVDSVFTVDPRIVPGAKPLPEMTYREMRELAYAGFSVFHDEAVEPAVRAGIPICVKNTFKPDAPGTMIVPERKHKEDTAVGIAGAEGFCTVYVSKYMMNREIGFGRSLLQIFEEEKLSYEHTPSGIDNMSVVLAEKAFTPEVERRVIDRIERELGAEASVERGLALIMIVGEGMHYSVGVAAKATRAFADAGVNIEMINQGSSEISMMFGVKASDRVKALQHLYAAFFG